MKEDIIKMAREAGFYDGEIGRAEDAFERFFHMAQAAEREACAKVCEAERRLGIDDERAYYGDLMVAAIRARGEV